MGVRRVKAHCEVCGNEIPEAAKPPKEDGLRKARIEDLQDRRAVLEDELTSVLEELLGLGVEV